MDQKQGETTGGYGQPEATPRLSSGYLVANRFLAEDIPWANAPGGGGPELTPVPPPLGSCPCLPWEREKATRVHGVGTKARNSRARLSNPLTIVLAFRKIRRRTGGGPKQAV